MLTRSERGPIVSRIGPDMPESNEKFRILIVESDRDLAGRLASLLGSSGYVVRNVTDPRSAASAVAGWEPQLILMGRHDPNGNEAEALEELRARASIPALLMLDEVTEAVIISSLAMGSTDIIRKPFSMAEFLLKIGHVLEREQQRKSLEELSARLLHERSVLARYFSDDVVSKIMQSDTKNLFGENLTASILFVDIRNFTAMSERLEPNTVAQVLCFLYTDIMDLIFGHHGSVNKLIGDAILATFGCPFNSPEDPLNAVRCAVAIRETIELFNRARPAYLTDEVRIGIGITTGKVFAGTVGSFRRMEYTVIGDAVNTASRLQTLTKKAGTDLLIDATTHASVEAHFETQRLQAATLRGKSAKVDVFTVLGPKSKNVGDSVTFF